MQHLKPARRMWDPSRCCSPVFHASTWDRQVCSLVYTQVCRQADKVCHRVQVEVDIRGRREEVCYQGLADSLVRKTEVHRLVCRLADNQVVVEVVLALCTLSLSQCSVHPPGPNGRDDGHGGVEVLQLVEGAVEAQPGFPIPSLSLVYVGPCECLRTDPQGGQRLPVAMSARCFPHCTVILTY